MSRACLVLVLVLAACSSKSSSKGGAGGESGSGGGTGGQQASGGAGSGGAGSGGAGSGGAGSGGAGVADAAVDANLAVDAGAHDTGMDAAVSGDAASPDGGGDAGTRPCGDATCRAEELCVSQLIVGGGDPFRPESGICPPPRMTFPEARDRCSNPPILRCAFRPENCPNPCTCATPVCPGSQCSESPPGSVRCVLLAP